MLTQEKLKKHLNYNPDTGIMSWILPRSASVSIGTAATVKVKGYLQLTIFSKRYAVHRLAWFYMTGCWPEFIDHINHIRNDNRWHNLRECSCRENQLNRTRQSNNMSGFTGVGWHKSSGRLRAYIQVEGRHIHLGNFNNMEDAIAARKAANIEYGFHPNHGAEK